MRPCAEKTEVNASSEAAYGGCEAGAREGGGKTVAHKATAQDVADLAGVSRSAVSLVLNGRAQGHIARDKQQAIIEAARRLNYTPNAVALSLRSQRTRTIGVLTWPGKSGFSVPMLHAALEKATAEGYLLIFMDTANDRDHQSRALATLHDHQVDALLVIAPDLVEYRPADVMSTIPTILVNCVDPTRRLTSIVADEYAAGAAAARVLIKAGHRRIGVVAGSLEALDSRLRLQGVEATAAAGHADLLVQKVANRDITCGFEATSALLLGPGAPTGLICLHERLAAGAALAAANLRVAVPNDLSLVSLEDGEQLASQLVPRLTTIERPDRAIAEKAVMLTLQRCEDDGDQSAEQLTFGCSAMARQSVIGPGPQNRRPCRPADKR
jgi:LacI family transcriptional regulator